MHQLSGRSIAVLLTIVISTPASAQSLIRWWDDPQPDGGFGLSLDAAGDVDGDGVGDFIAGAPEHRIQYYGRADVFSGATGELLWSWAGEDRTAQFGHAVAGPGDLDGDGHADLLVSAPYGSGGLQHPGFVYLYSGRTGERIRSWQGRATDPDRGQFGKGLAGIGDLDQDGVPEFAVAASADIVVFSGATGEALLDWSGSVSEINDGLQIAGLGDVNGDGVLDVGVGAQWFHGPAGSDSGIAYVFSGATGETLYTWLGEIWNGRFGTSIAGGGDFDGDGVPDVVVGAEGYDGYRGQVSVFSGATGERVWELRGELVDTSLGHDVEVIGDADGDGRSDLLVTADSARLSLYGNGLAYLYSGATRETIAVWGGETYADYFGVAAAAPGDLDGDGLDDVLVSSLRNPHGNTGRVYLLSPAPRPPELTLVQEGVAARGGTVDYVVSGAMPGETLVFRASEYGVGPGPCIPSLGGLCTELVEPDDRSAVVVADAQGEAVWSVPIPGFYEPDRIGVQVIAPRGAQAVRSNAVETLLE